MFTRLQRQNSFGPHETKSTLVISRAMELKILDGESSIPNASPVVLESINKSLETIINSHDRTKTVVHELPEFVKNTIISHCDLSEKELIDKRYGEYFEGFSLANNVQYIPVEIECLSNLHPDLCKSILALFVSVVFEYITEDKNSNVFELIKWGSIFLQRMGKMLGINENEVAIIIRPVSESLELKQLGMNFDDLKVEKQIHVKFILENLEPMQESIDEFFKQTMGTFDEQDLDYSNNNDFKYEDNSFRNDYGDNFKLPENFDKDEGYNYNYNFNDNGYGYQNDLEELKKKDKKHSPKESKEGKEYKEKESKELKKSEKSDKHDKGDKGEKSEKSEKKDKDKDKDKEGSKKSKKDKEDSSKILEVLDSMEGNEESEQNTPQLLERKSTDSRYSVEYYEAEMGLESEDEDEKNFKKNFVENYKPKKQKSKEQFDIKDLLTYLEPDDNNFSKDEENKDYGNEKVTQVEDGNNYSRENKDNKNNGNVGKTGTVMGTETNLSQEKENKGDKYDGFQGHQDSVEESSSFVQGYRDMSYLVPQTPRNTLVEQEGGQNVVEHKDDTQDQNKDSLVLDLSDFRMEEPNLDRHVSASALTEGSNTNMGEGEQETEQDDLLRELERSLRHRSSLPTNDYDNLLNDISNLNLPPKKNKSITSKIFSNISKKINRVFSINSEKSSKMSYTSSIQPTVNFFPNQDYLNNLLLIEKSPYIVAVLVRNLVLKYIISGFNDSRVQVVFERFSNCLGVTSSSVLSIENNIVSDLAGILDVSAAKTNSKKMSKRLKILSATVGGTALLALTAGVASPVLAVGVAFLGLGGTGVSSYLNSNEGSNILKNIFGLNVSLTNFKAKRELLTNLQFIQLNPNTNMYRDSSREQETSRFTSGRDSLKSDSTREKEELNNNFIGICICVGNNVFLNEMFFFENDSIDFKSVETIRHLDSEYIDIWKRQFPVPISDLYLLKWESKLMASLHRMLLKLTGLSIYQKSLELYQVANNTVFVTKGDANNHHHEYLSNQQQQQEEEPANLLVLDEVRDSSGGSRCTNLEGSSGNYYSNPSVDSTKQNNEGEEKEETPKEPTNDYYKNFKDVNINWPLGLVQLCSNLDNCWLVCRNRAETCGILLANAICDKLLTGDRHISLVGYSMGARVIFYCLLALYQRNKLHVVKDVVFMGLPSTAGYKEWTKCTSVVAGRIINVYNENDWLLAFLYRYTANYRVAGLAPVIHERVENYNVSKLFSSHVDYLENISKITSFLNIHI